MHQTLYRKYRPKSFDEVYGEDHITSVLRYEAKNAKFSHAYLFCGPRGTGKTSCAKILAKVVNCEAPENGNPCGKCPACLSIDNGTAADVLEMDAASNTGVEYIRDIREAVSFTPAAFNKRVYIIDEVHMLSSSAFNALLKTLEEPPEHVIFILATTEMHKLPATIISRCQRFDFRRIRTENLTKRLLYIAEKEEISLDEDAAQIIAKQSSGGMRDSISLFELCAAGGHSVTAERVRDTLGLAETEVLYKTAVAVAKNDVSAIFSIIDNVSTSSKDIAVFWSELTSFWRDMTVCKYLTEEEKVSYLDLTEPELKVLNDAARRFTKGALTYHFSILDDAMREMTRLPQTKRITAELALIKMSDPSLEDTNTALSARIASLEEKLTLLEAGSGIPQSVHVPAEPVIKVSEINPVNSDTAVMKADSDKITSEEIPVQNIDIIKTKADAELLPVYSFSDAVEKVSLKNSRAAAFLANCDCYASSDKMKVIIKTDNPLSKKIITEEATMQSLRSALHSCGIASPGADISVEIGMVSKKEEAMDELQNI